MDKTSRILDNKTIEIKSLLSQANIIIGRQSSLKGASTQNQYSKILELKNQGLEAKEISKILNIPKGEIELILNLRKGKTSNKQSHNNETHSS